MEGVAGMTSVLLLSTRVPSDRVALTVVGVLTVLLSWGLVGLP
jgi:hypothetical protein